MNDKTAIEKAREALKEIANQEVGTWDKPVPFSVLYRRSVDIAREALAAIDAEKLAEDAENVDSASWTFMSVTEMDVGFPERRERMKILIGQRDEKIRASYHAEQCKACSCNGCENEGQGMPICEMCQRNPNRSDYYKSLPGGS